MTEFIKPENQPQPHSTFELETTIEQKPFKSPAVQSFFTEWCRINDSIEPRYITREEWSGRQERGFLENKPDGGRIMFVPTDLQLWEMVGAIEAVDGDTFVNNPDRAQATTEKVLALGRTLENTGVYIGQRLDKLGDGQDIAEALALELFQYGQSLTQGSKQETPSIAKIVSRHLEPKETEEVDKFLAGSDLYQSRKQRIENTAAQDGLSKEKRYELERQKTLNQFFRVAKKAFILKNKNTKKDSPSSIPRKSNTPIHDAFIDRIQASLKKQIRTPHDELDMSIIRRGMNKLTHEMRTIYSILSNEQETIFNALNIVKLKSDLEQVRQEGDLAKIVSVEQQIADKIQRAVSDYIFFNYQDDGNNPAEIITKKRINCVGASLLGGGLMQEAGLDYLVGTVPGHSILLLVTSDKQLEWRDMLNKIPPTHLSDEMIEGRTKDGKPLTVADIIDMSQRPDFNSLTTDILGPEYHMNVPNHRDGQRQYLTIARPEFGQATQLLINTGKSLYENNRSEEAIDAYRRAIEIDPKNANIYNNLGLDLYILNRYEEAIDAYRRAIEIDPKSFDAHKYLGKSFMQLGLYKESIVAFKKAIDINPRDADIYNDLGISFKDVERYEEAIDAYRRAIEIDPKIREAYDNLNICLHKLGRHEEATKIDKAIAKL